MADLDQAVRDLRVGRIETARDVILLSRRRHELPLVGTEAEGKLSRRARHASDGPRQVAAECRGSLAGMFDGRSEEHTSELQSLMRISYAVFCLKKKKHRQPIHKNI